MVQALKGDYDWSINSIILDIKGLAVLFYFVDIDYILKILNWQAHMLAKFCYYARQDALVSGLSCLCSLCLSFVVAFLPF